MKKIHDVLIVGAGPSGIGIAALLQQMNCKSYLVLEKEDIGASFLKWPTEMNFITPSFPAQGFGQTDLNAIAPKTSPAYTLDMEHPTGEAYAEYLNIIVEHFELPIQTGVTVESVEKRNNIFHLTTSKGVYQSRYVIWAVGQYDYPNINPFHGSEHAIHNSKISSWKDLNGDEFIIIGGYESGMDAAYQLGSLGKKMTVIAKTNTWEVDSSDPSISLSPYTYNRIRNFFESDALTVIGDTEVIGIEKKPNGYLVNTSDGGSYLTGEKPILATGFRGGLTLIENLVTRGQNGEVLVNDSDESLQTAGLFIAGPELRHENHIFCYIYKFRQRYAVVAEEIGTQLNLDLTILSEYKRENFYLKDLSMCGENCQC